MHSPSLPATGFTYAIGCRLTELYLPVTACSNCRSISANIELAPNLNNEGSNQARPNSSFINPSQSSDCFAVLIPPAGLYPTAIPVRSAYSRIARTITSDTGSVAFTASFPVDVLIKSAPAIIATQLALATFRKRQQIPRPQDRLHMRRPTRLLERRHLVIQRIPLTIETHAPA